MTLALQINGLAVHYGSTIAVNQVTWTAPTGSVTALLGANGAGKTSTVEVCEGYLRPTGGEVRVLDLDPTRDQKQLRTRIGVMLQQGGVPSGARPIHALRHMASMYKYPLDSKQLLELVGLEKVDSTFKEMSGGEQQRLKLALALIGRPEMVFLDEPTAGLDAHGKRLVWQIIQQLRASGVTVLLTTHQMEDVEQLADQVVVMNHGEILTMGNPAELVAKHSEPRVEFATNLPIDVAGLQAVLPAGSYLRGSDGNYNIHGSQSTEALTAVTNWCTSQGIELLKLTTVTGNLEDVFVELTRESQ